MIWAQSDENGKIYGFIETSEFDTTPQEGVPVERVPNFDLEWLDGGELHPHPTIPLSVSGARITGIPAGSTLALGDQTFEVDDGEAEIDGYSGTVKITCWPYLDAEVVI